MSEHSNTWNALATIVDDFCDDNNIRHLWAKCLKWGIRAVREIRLDVHQQPKTALLDVTERKTVILPDGFVDWVKFAVKRGQYAITLSVNDELTIQKRTDNDDVIRGLLSQHMPNGTDFSQYGGWSLYNYNGSSIYSIGGGLPGKGYFKIVDRGTCKEAVLDYDYNFEQVYLEYITDGIDVCGETWVHPYEYDYVMAFMQEKYERFNNPKATIGSKDEAGRDVFFAEKKMRGRYNDLHPKDILNMSRIEARMTTKL